MATKVPAGPTQEGFKHTIEVPTLPNAKELVGYVVADRWEFTTLQYETKPNTGGNFGVGYFVNDRVDRVERFIKVVDFRARLADISQLTALLQVANFEVEMHKYCVRMSKVVRMLEHGQLFFVTPDGREYSFLCLVLEKGEGDIKSHVNFLPDQSPYWKLWVLRDVALAATQIERGNLAHNDIKPSNVIRFESKGTEHNIKLGDIGRAVTKSGSGPFDGIDWAGDPRHRPIELMYGWKEPEFQNRHTAADAYMLGNLMSFLFVGASLTERIVNSLPAEHRPGVHQGSYEQVLDIVRHAWMTVVREQIAPSFPPEVRQELTALLLCLTDPDPRVRGDAAARRQGLVGMDRIHSKLELLAKRSLIHERVSAGSQ